MSNMMEQITTIVLAIIGLAIVSVLVSKRANTVGVVQSLGSALGNNLAVAESPVTGATYGINLGYPGGSFSNAFGG